MKLILYKTIKHFFPEYRHWLKRMRDPRQPQQIDYQLPVMIWVGIFTFLFKLGARRQINFRLNTENMIKNLSLLGKEKVTKIPYDGTLAYLLKKLKVSELVLLREMMFWRLLRMRSLEKFRLFGYYLICIDGTGFLTYNYPHCKHCLTKKKNGKILYWYHPVLEAKLICGNGLVFSLATEFIENPNRKVKKQDCEIKAGYRLLEKLKKDFPQLSICLLLDGLYAKQKVFKLCKKNHWKYIITFKEGSMPATFAEYITLRSLEKENAAKIIEEKGITQEYRWVNGIEYKGYFLNVLECKEVKTAKDRNGKKIVTETKFVWLTNFVVDCRNYAFIANKGGRLRWKIENEGFNTQKNGGYNLEHVYCQDENAAKNFYLLLQIAHIINQLMELGNLLTGEVKKVFGSIKNFTANLLEDFRTSVFDLAEIQAIESSAFQIRLRGPT